MTRKGDRNSPCTHPAYRGNRRLWGSIAAVQQLPQPVEESFFPEGVDLEEHGLTAACGYLPDAYRGNRRLWGSIAAVQQLPQPVEESFFPEGVDLEEHGLTAACGYLPETLTWVNRISGAPKSDTAPNSTLSEMASTFFSIWKKLSAMVMFFTGRVFLPPSTR